MNFEKVKKVKRSKVFTVVDIVLAIVIAVAIGLVFWLVYRAPDDGLIVTVTAPDFEYTGFLNKDKTIELEHLTVHIENGKVWVADADCSDKTCERMGEISRAGQSIVCLPNGVVITVSGDGDLQWGVG